MRRRASKQNTTSGLGSADGLGPAGGKPGNGGDFARRQPRPAAASGSRRGRHRRGSYGGPHGGGPLGRDQVGWDFRGGGHGPRRGGPDTLPLAGGAPRTGAGAGGGLTPVILPAVFRPGALPEERAIPFPAAFARLGVTSAINVE